MTEIEKIKQAIQVLETQRAIIGHDVVDAALGPLREKLAALQASTPAGPAAGKEDGTQRRIITALFADVSGFTAMSEQMDAEDVRDTMNALWQRLDAVILANGGKIDKHMGDGVMALWGAEEAREDDPERALHAALGMQAELASFRPVLKAANGLKMRIGLNTGPVLFGSIGMRGEITAMGDTVNLASRLEQASPPGGILISHDTYRHVRGVFDVEPQAMLELKGKSEPVQTYLVREAKPRAFRLYTRGIEGVETHMVGRDAEMARLQGIFNQAFLQNAPQVVTVLGEAGIGKSRLLYEFNTWAELQTVTWWWFKGRASQSMLNTPYALLRDIFAFRFEIQDSDPLSVAQQKMEAGFREFLPGDEHAVEKAHIIGHLIGLDFADSPYLRGLRHDPRQMRQQALFYLTQFFKTAASHFAVLMMIDDLQWADTGSLDALTYLFGNLPPDTALMALNVARPALYEHYPRWGEGLPSFSRIELRSLTKEDSRHLVDQILVRVPDLPTAVRELVVGGAEGNPFYLEELIKMLIDSRVIQTDEENWRVDLTRLATVTVPPTLTEVLQARLDGLSAPERATLQRAAVMGRVFWDRALITMSETDETSTLEALAGLKRKELIYERRPSAFAGTREYTFKHTLLYEVTYETLLKRQRASYHAVVGDWLNRISGDRRGEYLAQIADHFEKGGDFARAAEVLSEAAQRALSLSALTEARSFFQRAIDLLKHPDKPIHEVISMETGLAETYIQMGEYSEARKHAELASTMAGEMKMDALVAEALIHLGQIASYLGNYADARSYLVGAHYLAHKEKVQPTLGRALVALGGIEWRLGNLEIAREYCSDALEIGKIIGDNTTVMMSLNRLGVVSGALGDSAEEERCYHETLTLALSVGNRERAATALNNLGAQAGEQGQWQKAWDYFNRALEISRETGAQQGVALHEINLGFASVKLGKLDESRRYLREGMALAARLGTLPVIVSGVTYFGLLAYAEGNVERALRLFGLAKTSPAFDSEAEREMAMFLDEWHLAPEQVAAGLESGAQLNLDEIVDELIHKAGPL